MLLPVNGSSQMFLSGLARIEATLTDAQDEVSSGVRVRTPADDPSAVPSILDIQARIGRYTQAQANLDQVRTELENGDSALQQAITAVEQAITIAAQGASDTTRSYPALLSQAQAIQQQLVSISRTAVTGRYIFSGDDDQAPLYELDPTGVNGVRLLGPAVSTRVVTDQNGAAIWLAKTAQDIFDPVNSPGNSVFAAINDLVQALNAGDPGATARAGDELTAAHDYLSQQLGLYGIAETRVSDAHDHAAASIVQEQQRLSELRDSDVAAQAIRISQATLQQQAALSARAAISQLSLFDFLA